MKTYAALLLVLFLLGCNRLGNLANGQISSGGIDRADNLALADQDIKSAIWQISPDGSVYPRAQASGSSLNLTQQDIVQFRNDYAEVWMARSDYLCREYKDRIISVSRGERLGTDILSGLLSGLATIFTKLETVHPLAGAATIITGGGAAISADTFAKETGDVIASAIETARENQANVIEKNLAEPSVTKYSIYRVRRDIVDYHNMCSLETGLSQIRTSLKQTSPDSGVTPPASQGSQSTGGLIKVGSTLAVPRGDSPVVAFAPLRRTIALALPGAETALSPEQGKKIEAVLCLKPDAGTVTFGPDFRTAVGMFRDAYEPTINNSDGLTTNEAGLLLTHPDCDRTRYRNAFEAFEYTTPKDIAVLQGALNDKAPASTPKITADGTLGPQTRDLIKAVQRQLCFPQTGEMTKPFLDKFPDPPDTLCHPGQ